MFKRFLKFFRGEEDAPVEPFEGSYLDHLLSKIRPEVADQLELAPDHDPLLLVVVGILRLTMMNEWSPLMRSPLVDSQSPGRKPPAVKNPAPESASTSEFPAATDDEVPADTVDDHFDLDAASEEDDSEPEAAESEPGEASEPSDPEEESEAEAIEAEGDEEDEAEAIEAEGDEEDEDGDETIEGDAPIDADDSDEIEALDDVDLDELEPPPVPSSTRKTEEIDVEEVRQASLRASLTETAELDRVEHELPNDPTIEIEHDALFAQAASADGRPRIDSEEVLQAGRVFLGLLIENDRLPIELQLTVAETTLARDLLLGYFIGNDDFEEKARKLLTLVEQKFGEGLFSQARILLQLFHTDEQTRINNDRNLFYEDMILRLGIRRRHRMSAEELKLFETLLSDSRSPTGAGAVCNWLADICLIHLHAFNRDPAQVNEWDNVLSEATREGARENFVRYLPARRWRPVGAIEEFDVIEHVQHHITPETAREYVISQIKTCYFVLRAVGDTGLEGFLDTFFDWSKSTFELDGTRLMPKLYKRSMMDPEPMSTILNDIYDEYYADLTIALMEDVTDERIEEAMYDALIAMGTCDLGEVAPGYYDIGAFVFDQLFGVKYPTAEFPFKVHRIT